MSLSLIEDAIEKVAAGVDLARAAIAKQGPGIFAKMGRPSEEMAGKLKTLKDMPREEVRKGVSTLRYFRDTQKKYPHVQF